jgi:DNA polymerase
MTPYQLHVRKWEKGCGNEICSVANRVCLVRGQLPCDVLFIAEAPGESENVLGRPLVGPAGQLLDRIIVEAFGDVLIEDGRRPRVAFTNIVGCIPRDEDGKKATAPDPVEIKKCAPRLRELVRLARPRMIVTVGALARRHVSGQAQFGDEDGNVDWLPPGQEFVRFVEIVHPAAILRGPTAAQGFTIQKTVVTLSNAVEDL